MIRAGVSPRGWHGLAYELDVRSVAVVMLGATVLSSPGLDLPGRGCHSHWSRHWGRDRQSSAHDDRPRCFDKGSKRGAK